MKHACAVILILTSVSSAEAGAGPQRLGQGAPIEWWHQYADGLPLATQIAVQTTDGRRYEGALVAVDETGLQLRQKTRLPEPDVRIEFDRLARLIKVDKRGPNFWSRLGVGSATGVGVFMGALLSTIYIVARG